MILFSEFCSLSIICFPFHLAYLFNFSFRVWRFCLAHFAFVFHRFARGYWKKSKGNHALNSSVNIKALFNGISRYGLNAQGTDSAFVMRWIWAVIAIKNTSLQWSEIRFLCSLKSLDCLQYGEISVCRLHSFLRQTFKVQMYGRNFNHKFIMYR